MKVFVDKVSCDSPELKMVENGKWEYVSKWDIEIVLHESGVLRLSIRPGYWTDLASVPRALRGAFDNGSAEFGVLIASQVHDALYSTHYLSRTFADDLFEQLLLHYGMGKIKARLYWLAVHLFGNSAWEVLSEEQMFEDRRLCTMTWLDR